MIVKAQGQKKDVKVTVETKTGLLYTNRVFITGICEYGPKEDINYSVAFYFKKKNYQKKEYNMKSVLYGISKDGTKCNYKSIHVF